MTPAPLGPGSSPARRRGLPAPGASWQVREAPLHLDSQPPSWRGGAPEGGGAGGEVKVVSLGTLWGPGLQESL